jgi:tRNA pseudouridine(38-40) synthase
MRAVLSHFTTALLVPVLKVPSRVTTIAVLASSTRTPSSTPSPYKKRHALLTFGYCGTGYWGLQSQNAEGDPDRPTVSDVIRRALLNSGAIAPTNFAPIMRTKWQLASRTDKGVHAACAAASCNIETLAEEVLLEPGEEGQEARYWELTPEAIARINTHLPREIRLFSATRVRKRFSAHESASSRTYEYLLPEASLGGASAEDLDAVLRAFEGSHKFHNFASGLRRSKGSVPDFEAEGESWPLALDTSRHSAAFRSVLHCRVHRSFSIEGTPYLLLRISGLAFVLHQIRHMVGAAVAVTVGAVPKEAMITALKTPMEVNVSPLAPGCGLLLDEIRWFDVGQGEYEAEVPTDARQEMAAFKEQVIYPHIHSLYQDQRALDVFLNGLISDDPLQRWVRYTDDDYARLRRVHDSWTAHVEQMVCSTRHTHARTHAFGRARTRTHAHAANTWHAYDTHMLHTYVHTHMPYRHDTRTRTRMSVHTRAHTCTCAHAHARLAWPLHCCHASCRARASAGG